MRTLATNLLAMLGVLADASHHQGEPSPSDMEAAASMTLYPPTGLDVLPSTGDRRS